jgi:uncharacterized delta-60 repeat protein
MKSFLTICMLLAGLSLNAQHVSTDPSFGQSGIVAITNTSEINCLVVNPDGSIISAGYTLQGGGTGIYHLTLSKTDANGVADYDFGVNGLVTTEIEYSEFPLDILLQPDGKIIVAGSYYVGPGNNGPGTHEAFTIRYHTNGITDSTFGEYGVYKSYDSDSHISSLMLLADGSILLGGNNYTGAILTKLKSNGIADEAFGINGTLQLSSPDFRFIFWQAALLSDGNIICVGYEGSDLSNYKTAYCKLDISGNYIPGFGQGGRVVTDIYDTMPNIVELLSVVRELPGGKILMAGYHMSAMLLQINADGTPDLNFGINGLVNHRYPFKDLEIQADGRILIGGSKEISDYNYGYTLSRLMADGSPDTSFNGSGTFDLDISPANDYLQTMKMQSPGKLIAGGSSRLNGSANFTLTRINLNTFVSTSPQVRNTYEPSIYPNPFRDHIFISDDQHTIQKINLLDYTGRMIQVLNNPGHATAIFIDQPAGIYFLQMETNSGQVITRKLIRQ